MGRGSPVRCERWVTGEAALCTELQCNAELSQAKRSVVEESVKLHTRCSPSVQRLLSQGGRIILLRAGHRKLRFAIPIAGMSWVQRSLANVSRESAVHRLGVLCNSVQLDWAGVLGYHGLLSESDDGPMVVRST